MNTALANLIAVGLMVFAASVMPAAAYEHFSTYRILGSEIQAADIIEPEPEDPWVLAIDVGADAASTETIKIESDDSIDHCRDMAHLARDGDQLILKITVWDNADSMNGAFVVECAIELNLSQPAI